MKGELRASTPAERLALKAAVKRASKLAGGAASVQHVTRVCESDLSRYAGAEYEDRHCPVDVALDLDREAGHPVILSALAAILGYRLVAAEGAGDGGIGAADIAALFQENAEFAEAAAAGASRITATELGRIERGAERAVAAVRRVEALARAGAGKVRQDNRE